jgi:hypothetical protein
MNGTFLTTRDLAISYLYGMKDGDLIGGVSPFPYCQIAQSWMLNSRLDKSLRALRRQAPDNTIETAFEYPQDLFLSYAIDQVGFRACLNEVISSACRSCVFSKALPIESMDTLTLNDRLKGKSQINLKDAAAAHSVEYHNQDFGGQTLCHALVRQLSYSLVAFSDLTKRGQEIHDNFPAIVIRANSQLEPLMFHPQLPLGEMPAVNFKLHQLKAETHQMGKR